jgi:Ca2+-binding RTX toxin-like protein
MTPLDVIGQTQSNQGMLDTGITDLLIHETAAGPVLYTLSGPTGGVAAYALGGPGGPALIDFAVFGPAYSESVMDTLTLLETPGGPRLVVAGDANDSLTSFAIGADGTLGAEGIIEGLANGSGGTVLDIGQWNDDLLFVTNPGSTSVEVYGIDPGGTLSRAFSVPDTPGTYADTVFAVETVSLGGNDYLIAASASESGVTAYRIEADRLIATGSLGADQGIGIMTPTALGAVAVEGRSFILLGSAPGDGIGQSGAITVMELLPGGQLAPTDHVIDTLDTRFGGIQSLETVQSNGFTYVIAGGGDDGLTVFLLMPNGRLQMIDVRADSHDSGLENVTAIAAHATGDSVRVFVSSEISPGITELSLDTSRNGSILVAQASGGQMTGTALDDILSGGAGNDLLQGSSGDDILEDGAGQDTLSGGAGNDLFVLRSDGTTDGIIDFELGRDRIDLSSWPFLYDPTELTVQSTAGGAIVTWRGETLIIETVQGVTLTKADVVASILSAPNRSPIPFDPPPAPTATYIGTSGNDSYAGGADNDTILGEGGDDTLLGGPGLDSIEGGVGNDEIRGNLNGDTIHGGDGFDRLYGNFGFDTIYGGANADEIYGGNQNDRLYGERGNDLVVGQSGNDTIWGGTGFDTLRGGADDDLIYGGDLGDQLIGGIGDDTLLGELGNDRLDGNDGADSLDGGEGIDALYGGPGDDTLLGGAGDDRIFAGLDDDRIDGGTGDDTIFGSAGVDTFVFAPDHGDDVIRDFDPHGEIIDLTALGTAFGALAIGPMAGGVLVTTSGGTILLEGVAESDLGAGDFLF